MPRRLQGKSWKNGKSSKFFHIFLFFHSLTKKKQCAILQIGKKVLSMPCGNTEQNPQQLPLLGVSSAFTEQSTEADYRKLFLSIQPFANVVANYTCHDRKK